MSEQCAVSNRFSRMSYEEIVNAFICIGETAQSSEEALSRTVALNNQLADQFGIDPLQASLFSARFLDYRPQPGTMAKKIHRDLVAEMKAVVGCPETREPVNDTTKTGIAGLDRYRQLGAGKMIGLEATVEKILMGKDPSWPRNEAGAEFFRMKRWEVKEILAVLKEIQKKNPDGAE